MKIIVLFTKIVIFEAFVENYGEFLFYFTLCQAYCSFISTAQSLSETVIC